MAVGRTLNFSFIVVDLSAHTSYQSDLGLWLQGFSPTLQFLQHKVQLQRFGVFGIVRQRGQPRKSYVLQLLQARLPKYTRPC